MLYKNILLIDDDHDDAELFLEAVASLNKEISIRWIASPRAAMEELISSEYLPDLIFLDYNMPLINGGELLEKLKSNNRLSSIPVILISTPSEEFMKLKLEQNAIIKYFKKPNSYSELIAILDSIL
ncbi:response regulator [Flavobacterium johnsoniae]|jgi:CheY-like chemotaxis protein|uniref:Response regulator receiver domain-containing protein n=2 Tax=Flavobacterium johnsoniae TaxID=986 RepID=A0A1M5V9X6_FLAJO|nr:response regulator [Flavobacterium johnsoniae]ABQ06798.1 response regulator receiver protein [Flavobacterium johnsoniae UW101]OXE97338.1 response regulator [Flavobacterium johnsoniae UW101]WQG81370.1 response regulator [Flavobacterium johnsoniae UW101]SHH71948.1 Response regulator receiver domain-containing protein [Flavobacterium johnsoniae]SHL40254.1 Response regulator receiver domain-containing protein [Flavobacterium johnsoniae]